MDGKWYFIPLFLMLLLATPFVILHEKISAKWKKSGTCKHEKALEFKVPDGDKFKTCPDCGVTTQVFD